jgi:hypothetical protein
MEKYTWYRGFLSVLNKNVFHRNVNICSTAYVLMLRHKQTDNMTIYSAFIFFAKNPWSLTVIFDIICESDGISTRGDTFCIVTIIRDWWRGFLNPEAVRDFPISSKGPDSFRSCLKIVSQCVTWLFHWVNLGLKLTTNFCLELS